MSNIDYDKGQMVWGDMFDYSPAPLHRRRLILEQLKGIEFNTLLDIGCGNGRLLSAINAEFEAGLSGVDISGLVIEENKKKYPLWKFYCLEISENKLEEKFDVVICSEVLEHIKEKLNTLNNIRGMLNENGHLLLTVPAGKVFPIDYKMGHYQHFNLREIEKLLDESGFTVKRAFKWGFPFHTLYKYLINVFPEATNDKFASNEYGYFEKVLSNIINFLFFFNIKGLGMQLIVLAQKK